MRLSLTNQARATLEQLQARCTEINPNVEAATSTFLVRFLDAVASILNRDQLADIANQLTSEKIKRQRIRARLIKLGEELDESDIEKFENKIAKKRTAANTVSAENAAENS